MFETDEKLPHIARVDSEVREMFRWLRTDRRTMEEAFCTPFDSIDIDRAWAEYDPLSYRESFKETYGEPDSLYDPMVRTRIFNRVKRVWPVIYHMKMFADKGIADVISTPTGDVYFFKEKYKAGIRQVLEESQRPSENTMSTPSATYRSRKQYE